MEDVTDLKTQIDQRGIPSGGSTGQSLRKKSGTNYDIEWADVGLPTDEQTSDAVSAWLDDHPEATTTVEDHSLTHKKLINGTLGFVTPEMFGAVGDGITDDTNAWQAAVDFGLAVKAGKSSYKCGTITVTKNIDIDCNKARFICTEDKLFDCEGEVITTLQNESDYSKNQSDYVISNVVYANYTGFAMLKGTNNYEKSRDYYRGGFVCEFYEGRITGTYPIDVTGVSIEIINPIKVNISNIGDIEHSISQYDYTITINYGFGCTIRDCNIWHSGAYTVIMLYNCLNCICDNINIKQSYSSNNNDSYLVVFANSSYCIVRNSYMYNKNWHCITTGNVYLCYHNVVDNCSLYTNGSVSFEDHENALNSIIINSTCACIGIGGMGVVDNCNIVSIQSDYKHCQIRIIAMSNRDNAIYSVNNVRFLPSNNINLSYCGIKFVSSSRTTGNNYYIKQAIFKNVKGENNNVACSYSFNFSTQSTNIIGDIVIDNSNFMIDLGVYGDETHIDISNYILCVQNCHAIEYDVYYPYLGETSRSYNVLHLHNCKLGRLRGNFSKAYLNDVEIVSTVSGTTFVVTDELFGSNIRAKFQNGVTTNPSKLRITDFQNAGVMLLNVFSAHGTTKKYSQYYMSDGTLTTEEIAI